jgi:hypothetical protein
MLRIENTVTNIQTNDTEFWMIYDDSENRIIVDPIQCSGFTSSPFKMIIADTIEELLQYADENDILVSQVFITNETKTIFQALNSGYTLHPACLRFFTVSVNNQNAAVDQQQNANTTNNKNLFQLTIDNGIMPSEDGSYAVVYEFYGARTRATYDSNGNIVEPSLWFSDDTYYRVFVVEHTGSLTVEDASQITKTNDSVFENFV